MVPIKTIDDMGLIDNIKSFFVKEKEKSKRAEENSQREGNPQCVLDFSANEQDLSYLLENNGYAKEDGERILEINGIKIRLKQIDGSETDSPFYIMTSHVNSRLWNALMPDFDKRWQHGTCIDASIPECREFIKRLNEESGMNFDFISPEQWMQSMIKYYAPASDYIHVFMWSRKDMDKEFVEYQAEDLDIPDSLICSLGNGYDAFVLYLSASE